MFNQTAKIRKLSLSRMLGALACAGLAMVGCSGGGSSGGGSAPAGSATLVSVEFLDPNSVNPESEATPPAATPLNQRIRFTFSRAADPSEVGSSRLPILRRSDNAIVSGQYDVAQNIITFTPDLPTTPVELLQNGTYDVGGSGLEPTTAYYFSIGPNSWNFVGGVSQDLRQLYPDPADSNGILMGFSTTADPAIFFAGVSKRTPQVLATEPADGSTDVSPNLYTDPQGMFPMRQVFLLRFDGALRSDLANVSDQTFTLINLDNASLSLGVNITILSNQVNEALVEVAPAGILPFGALLALEYPTNLQGLAQTGSAGPGTLIAGTFTTAAVPTGVTTVIDDLAEDYDTNEYETDSFEDIQLGQIPASWNQDSSRILQAAIAVEDGGLLGPFTPTANPNPADIRTIFFDTSNQNFPLLDGSTPLAPPNTTIQGGVFPFTNIDIPRGVRIAALGDNPLVFTATGTVHIAGEIIVDGGDGVAESAYDSAVTSIPGGNGVANGGDGGESYPIFYFPPTQPSTKNLVSPPISGHGWGPGNVARTGGKGGENGHTDNPDADSGAFGTDSEITCGELQDTHNNRFNIDPKTGQNYPKGFKPPGGGGGSYLTQGDSSLRLTNNNNPSLKDVYGLGNVRADGLGGWNYRTLFQLMPGAPGIPPFADGNTSNDFIGFQGELQAVRGGQGGGAGGAGLDSYFCGDWCRNDADPNNDNLCQNESLGRQFAGSVGDSRGGSAGAGGGAIVIRALGPVTITGVLSARGGQGGGGEAIECSNWSGAGASGSGGAIIVQSGVSIDVSGTQALLDVSGGDWVLATNRFGYVFPCPDPVNRNNKPNGEVKGDGGRGGRGIIQLQTPFGTTATVQNPALSIAPLPSWVDQNNNRNPSEFTPISVALSDWFDLGRSIDRPPTGTNPVYEFLMNGVPATSGDTGFVAVDGSNRVVNPDTTDIVCDYLGLIDPATGQFIPGEEPRQNFIPPNATIRVEFQGADAIAPGSKEVDPASIVPAANLWSPTPAVANGKQFLRYRITFDVTADGSTLAADSRLPTVQSLRIRARF